MDNKNEYIASVLLIEKIYKSFLNLVKRELDNIGILDINNIQALLIYQIGNTQIKAAELITKGYYSGSNASYNIKKMVEAKYIEQTKSKRDKREILLKLTNKGMQLFKKMDTIFEKHALIFSKDAEMKKLFSAIKQFSNVIINPVVINNIDNLNL